MKLQSWVHTGNGMIHTENTMAMSFHSRKYTNLLKLNIKFNNMDTVYKPDSKFLGIHSTENMKLNVHVRSLSSKLSKVCYNIKSFKEVMSPHAIRNNNFDNFQTHLEYGLIFLVEDTESKATFKFEKRVM